ncbi:MAG: Ig-like domain-containing protein, partial [Victivallales bacterium]|nr:Ig-like domain-containing protein [Victivallales bacterium]
VTAADKARGIDFYYESTSSSNLNTKLTFDAMNLNLNVESTGASAYGIRTYLTSSSSSGQFTTDLSFGDMNGSISVKSLTSDAYAVYAYGKSASALTIDNMSGTVIASSNGNSYSGGLYNGATANAVLTIKSVSGLIAASSPSGIARAIDNYSGAGSGSMNGGYVDVVVQEAQYDEATGEQISAEVTEKQAARMEISGTVIANGKKGAYAIRSNTEKHLNITGIVAAGNYSAWIKTEEDLESFVNTLANPSSWQLTNIKSRSNGYAIADGYQQSWDSFIQTKTDDDIVIGSSALILGNIALGGGTNSLTISSGARIYGSITADSLDLTVNLDDSPENGAIITAKEAGALAADNTTYTINITEKSSSGRYVLATAADLSGLEGKTFTVNYLNEVFTLTADDSFDDNPLVDINIVDGRELELVLADSFFVYRSSLSRDLIGVDSNGVVTLAFSRGIDEASFSTDMLSLTDQNGDAITITDCEISGNELTIHYTPLTEEGVYTLTVSETIKSVEGNALNQNLIGEAGEKDDAYTRMLTADFTGP